MSNFQPSVKGHGGSRKGAGAPKGKRRKRRSSSFRPRKQTTPARKRFKMMDNYKNHKIDTMAQQKIALQQENDRLNAVIQRMYSRFGEFMDHSQIKDILNTIEILQNKDEFDILQFNLILALLYRARVAFKNIHEVVITMLSILWNMNEEEIKRKVLSKASMVRWGRFRANWFIKANTALYFVLVCPESQVMYKNDGTERNQDNLFGHVLEFAVSQQKKEHFKKCIIDGKTVGIDHFSSYERNSNCSRLVFAYNQSVGKTADCLKQSTDEALDDFNDFIRLWQTPELKSVLEAEFGADNLNYTPINDRVNAFGHDRHSVKRLQTVSHCIC